MSAQPISASRPHDSRCLLRQALLGLAFLGVVAMLSLPAARGVGAVGWMPLWLLATPLAGLLALALADLRDRGAADGRARPATASRRRGQPLQARRRAGARPAGGRRRPQAPAAA